MAQMFPFDNAPYTYSHMQEESFVSILDHIIKKPHVQRCFIKHRKQAFFEKSQAIIRQPSQAFLFFNALKEQTIYNLLNSLNTILGNPETHKDLFLLKRYIYYLNYTSSINCTNIIQIVIGLMQKKTFLTLKFGPLSTLTPAH